MTVDLIASSASPYLHPTEFTALAGTLIGLVETYLSALKTPSQKLVLLSLVFHKAADVRKDVMDDIGGYYRVARNNEFLDAVLPIGRVSIDDIYSALVDKQLYVNQRWEPFPKNSSASETSFYSPFIVVAEAICQHINGVSTPNDLPSRKWIDLHSKSPKSDSRYEAAIQPDTIFAVNAQHYREVEAKIVELTLKVEDLEGKRKLEKDNTRKVENSKQLERERTALFTPLNIWWRQIHVPVEIKPDKKQALQAFQQLCGYLRLCLRHQLDRRYILGLTFCFDSLKVWLCDRSGVVGMMESVNIHEKPKEFIRIISSLCSLDATKLGWDSSMRLYNPTTKEERFSYDIRNKPEDFGGSRYKTCWAIDIISPDKKEYETVITVGALSITRAEIMRGRATLVWEVVKRSDLPHPQELYVLKRYWRPYIKLTSSTAMEPVEAIANYRQSEGDLYQFLGSMRDRIYSFGDIHIGGVGGPVDSTMEFIRCNIETEIPTTTAKGKMFDPDEDSDDDEPLLHRNTVIPITASALKSRQEIESRVHTAILMKKTGWSIRYFASLLELLQVTLQCIKDSKYFFTNGGDVSIGNIIITAVGNDGKEIEGRLIDLDHAKWTEHKARVKENILITGDVEKMQQTLAPQGFCVDTEVASELSRTVGMKAAPEYLEMLQSYFGLSKQSNVDSPYTYEDLGWTRKNEMRPTFRFHEASKVERTGTLPYMSAEVLLGNFSPTYFKIQTNQFHWENDSDLAKCGSVAPSQDSDFFHDAIHDMESLYWVIVEICLTRCGAGAKMVREELNPSSEKYNSELVLLITNLFDSPKAQIIKDTKNEYLLKPGTLAQNVYPHFHPYFRPLVTMVKRLWDILVIGYKYRGSEYHHIHTYFIDIITEQIASLRKDKPDDKSIQMAATEYDRRTKYIFNRLNTFADLTSQNKDFSESESGDGAARQFPPASSTPRRNSGNAGPLHKKRRT